MSTTVIYRIQRWDRWATSGDGWQTIEITYSEEYARKMLRRLVTANPVLKYRILRTEELTTEIQ